MVFGLGVCGRFAWAQPMAPPVLVVAAQKPPLRSFALTISPLHLVLPVVELTGEFRVGEKMGIAAVLGAGSVTIKDAMANEVAFKAFEVGGQFRYYLLGNFRHGMQVGAELLYFKVSGNVRSITGMANGFTMGPFVGYKFTSRMGLTFDTQIGIERAGIAASAYSSAGETASVSTSRWAPLLNINIGWSF